MSGTVMKFGPQWIRTLTDGAAPSSATSNPASNNNNNTNTNNNNSSSSTTNHSSSSNLASFNNSSNTTSNCAGKYKLAEYRYGREEMLALFEQEMDAPEDIKKFTDLFVEKARMPMAMTQMSEEEVKLSTRNWNSEAVLRSTGKAAASTAVAGASAGASSATGIPAGAFGGLSSTSNDRDNRQLSERGAPGALTAAGVLSSSPRGPPGSLSRIPIEQRGLLSSLNPRGPSTIRNLVGRGPNMYIRSQSHDDEGVDEGASGNSGFDTRFGLPGQPRQPSSLRARFETNRTASGPPGSKPIDIKSGNTIDGDPSGERRSVFDRLPGKYSVDDKNVRKDVNGRPIQSGDWRSREWSGGGPDNRTGKIPTEERSWRSSRGGAAEDWRSNNSSATSSSWYVRTDDQRIRAGAQQNQENINSAFSGKRDTVRRPSADERQGDEDEDGAQPRHRRDSLPEWSIGDPLSGDKVGSFDATGAFREIAREDGRDSLSKEKNQQDPNVYDMKSASSAAEQEWRLKANYSSNTFNMSDSRNLKGVISSNSLGELEKLSLVDRNAIPKREAPENTCAPNESSTKNNESKREGVQDRFNDANFQNSIHTQMSSNKVTSQNHTASSTTNNEHKKTIDNSRNSVSPHSCQHSGNQPIPANLQQMLKKSQQQQQQQSFLNAVAGSSNAIQPPNDEDEGFAHLERAAECMVAEWTAEEEQETSSRAYFGNKLNLTGAPDAQTNNHNNAEARISNQQKQQQQHQHQQQQQKQQQQHQQLHHQQQQQQQQHHQQQQQSVTEQTSNNSSASDANNQKKLVLLPFNHEDSQQWFYRDTQGVIQGPFSATEMFEWYKAGYFVKELLVRRACDEMFYQLGDVIKMWERIPFAPIPMNVPPPPPITAQALLQFRAVTKQLELAAGMNPSQSQIPPNAFGITHPGTVLLHGPIIQQQQQQVHQVLAAASLNQNISAPQEQQAGIRQILEATRQHDQTLAQQQRAHPSNVLDQAEMQTQLRQLLAQLKNREGFANLNAQEQQELLVRQFVASRSLPGSLPEQDQTLLQRARMMPFLPFFANEQERFRYQQRVELEQRQKEEAEKQNRFIMEQRMKAEEEKQRIMDEMQKRQRKQKEESEKQQRQEAEEERLLKLSQLKQQQLAKQQEEFRQQMHNQRLQQQQQQEKKQQQAVQLNSIQQQQQAQQQQQQQQIERAKKAAQAQQVQQEQQRKPAWSTVSKADQEPVSLATLQKMQEEEKEKERERQRQIQQQIQSNQQQQQQLQQLQRQMTWANAAQQSKAAPVKTLAEIQKEEEERLAREKQKKTKVQPAVPNAGVWNNAASHLSWKNPPADS